MRTLYDMIGKVEAVVAGILLTLMVLLIFSGGLARLAAHPLNWTIDFATCFFAWGGRFACSAALAAAISSAVGIPVIPAPPWKPRLWG